MRLNNISLIFKLSLVPAIILVLVLIHSVIVTWTLRDINSNAEHFAKVIEPSARLSSSLTTNVLSRANLIERYLKQPSPALLQDYMNYSSQAKDLFSDENFTALQKHKDIETASNQLDTLFINTLAPNDRDLREKSRKFRTRSFPRLWSAVTISAPH
ncbi:hypothetical protein [Hahella ganghwensis]|uniref:hypothetical protein n=1 Tax=Hahella ganghwensis TaxID=286420 RepID=UPI00037BFA34|nr:hypothetical protein [Hahella ganghwensis]